MRAICFRAAVLPALVVGIGVSSTSPARAGAPAGQCKRQVDMPQRSASAGGETSIEVTVCAPKEGGRSTGDPAGFSLQWMSCDDFAANGDRWAGSDDPRLCAASFSGNARGSRYELAPGACVTVNVGDLVLDAGASTSCNDALSCGTCEVFRAFAHATRTLQKSGFTNDLTASTTECGGTGEILCSYSLFLWQRSQPCNPTGSTAWPVDTLVVGTVPYDTAGLCRIVAADASANALVDLGQQLIAAKLNVAEARLLGALPLPAGVACIAQADALVGSLVIPPVGSGVIDAAAVAAVTQCLRDYNNGGLGNGSCEDN